MKKTTTKNKTKFSKVSDPPLDMGLFVVFCFCGFPEGLFFLYVWFSRWFCWFCKNFREHQKNKNKKTYPRVSLKPLKTLFLLVVPNVLLVFCGLILYVWLSRRICWFCKNLRENQKVKTKQKHIQG